MTEHKKQTVAAAKEFGASDLMQDLVLLVGRLDNQLAEIVEAGEPFRKVAARIEAHLSDCWIIYSTSLLGDGEIVNLQVGDIRRLAEVLKGVKDE